MLRVTDGRLSALERQIRAYCEAHQIFGVLRVTGKDEILFEMQTGYADLARQEPFTPKSVFSWYSLSKPFCVLGFLKLVDRGLVSLDEHPARTVPEAAGLDARVTFRHMLHHVSGIPDFEQNGEFAAAHAPGYARYARAHLAELARFPSYFAAGEGAMYANVNMVIPALAVENITGTPYPYFMQREIFAPLGMHTATVDDEERHVPHRVQGYALGEDGTPVPVEKSHDWLLGAGDIVGTVKDVYALNRAIKEWLLLSPDLWRQVLTPHPKSGMGMGCTVSNWHGWRRITHNGGHTGFRTLHVQLPEEDFDLIFLSNSGYGNARNDISEMVYRAFFGDFSDGAAEIAMDRGYI